MIYFIIVIVFKNSTFFGTYIFFVIPLIFVRPPDDIISWDTCI